MPTYMYVCKRCSHSFERFQKISDDPVKRCPQCGAKVERVITGGGGILFKGEGFYCTDYRSEEYKKKARSESSENSEKSGDSGVSKNKDGKESD
jgi:putative FmdB family regulatory protein